MDKKNKTKRLHIRLHNRPDMSDRLDRIAQRQKPKSITRNELVLRILDDYVKKYEYMKFNEYYEHRNDLTIQELEDGYNKGIKYEIIGMLGITFSFFTFYICVVFLQALNVVDALSFIIAMVFYSCVSYFIFNYFGKQKRKKDTLLVLRNRKKLLNQEIEYLSTNEKVNILSNHIYSHWNRLNIFLKNTSNNRLKLLINKIKRIEKAYTKILCVVSIVILGIFLYLNPIFSHYTYLQFAIILLVIAFLMAIILLFRYFERTLFGKIKDDRAIQEIKQKAIKIVRQQRVEGILQ